MAGNGRFRSQDVSTGALAVKFKPIPSIPSARKQIFESECSVIQGLRRCNLMQGLCKHITEISGHDRLREQGQPAAGQAVGRAHGGHALHAARAQEHCDGSRLESGTVVAEIPLPTDTQLLMILHGTL